MLSCKNGKQVYFRATEVVAMKVSDFTPALVVDVKNQPLTNATLGFLFSCNEKQIGEINSAVDFVQEWQHTETVEISFARKVDGKTVTLSPAEIELLTTAGVSFMVSGNTTGHYDDEYDETHHYIIVTFLS